MEDFHIQWHITEKCNFNCIHCYREDFRKELDFDNLRIIADKLKKFAILNKYDLSISLTGGEPFLKSEIYLISNYLNLLDEVKEINFITNCSVLPDIDELKKISKLKTIYVSLESLDPNVNDKIRGFNSYKIVYNNLLYLAKKFNVGVMTTLMNTNINYLKINLKFFVETLFSHGVKEIIFERFIPVGKSKFLTKEIVKKNDILEFYFEISKIFNIEFEDLILYPAVKILNKYEENILIYGAKCIFSKNGFAILCDGSIYPCRRFDYELLNLMKEDLIDYNKLFLSHNFSFKKDFLGCYAMNKSLILGN